MIELLCCLQLMDRETDKRLQTSETSCCQRPNCEHPDKASSRKRRDRSKQFLESPQARHKISAMEVKQSYWARIKIIRGLQTKANRKQMAHFKLILSTIYSYKNKHRRKAWENTHWVAGWWEYLRNRTITMTKSMSHVSVKLKYISVHLNWCNKMQID